MKKLFILIGFVVGFGIGHVYFSKHDAPTTVRVEVTKPAPATVMEERRTSDDYSPINITTSGGISIGSPIGINPMTGNLTVQIAPGVSIEP